MIPWRFSRRAPPEPEPPSAQAAYLRAEVQTLPDKAEREQLLQLLEQVANSTDPGFHRVVTKYVRRQVMLAVGPDQLANVFMGVAFGVVMVVVATAIYRANADVWPLGLPAAVFFWGALAGAAGGVIRVLFAAASHKYSYRSKLLLGLVGLMHPMVGAVLGVVAMVLFDSGLVAMPVEEPERKGVVSSWSRAEEFLVLAAFMGGLAEDWVIGLLSRVRSLPGAQPPPQPPIPK